MVILAIEILNSSLKILDLPLSRPQGDMNIFKNTQLWPPDLVLMVIYLFKLKFSTASIKSPTGPMPA